MTPKRPSLSQLSKSLPTIPANLVACAQAKAKAAPEAANQVAAGTQKSASLAALGSAHLARTTGQGGKRLGDKMMQGAHNAKRNMADVAKTMKNTATDVGRIAVGERIEVLRAVPHSPRQALLAPPKLIGKGIKARWRMATGAAKTTAKIAKGGATMAKDAVSITATGMVESARVGKAMAETCQQLREAGLTVAQSGQEALYTLIAA